MSSSATPLSVALAKPSGQGTFRLYSIDVGGETYVGFTSKSIEDRIQQHIEKAKQGSPFALHKKLREFGYYCHHRQLGTFNHEVEALVNEVKYIKKLNASLNLTEGGEGKNFRLVRQLNEFGEDALAVIDLKSVPPDDVAPKVKETVMKSDKNRYSPPELQTLTFVKKSQSEKRFLFEADNGRIFQTIYEDRANKVILHQKADYEVKFDERYNKWLLMGYVRPAN